MATEKEEMNNLLELEKELNQALKRLEDDFSSKKAAIRGKILSLQKKLRIMEQVYSINGDVIKLNVTTFSGRYMGGGCGAPYTPGSPKISYSSKEEAIELLAKERTSEGSTLYEIVPMGTQVVE